MINAILIYLSMRIIGRTNLGTLEDIKPHLTYGMLIANAITLGVDLMTQPKLITTYPFTICLLTTLLYYGIFMDDSSDFDYNLTEVKDD